MGDKLKRDKRDFFICQNMIFNLKISAHAKITYMYLSRCADSEGQAYPGIKNIGVKCGISESAVKRALKELITIGLLLKKPQFNDTGQTSNIYKIFDTPTLPDFLPVPDRGGSERTVKTSGGVEYPEDTGDRRSFLPMVGSVTAFAEVKNSERTRKRSGGAAAFDEVKSSETRMGSTVNRGGVQTEPPGGFTQTCNKYPYDKYPFKEGEGGETEPATHTENYAYPVEPERDRAALAPVLTESKLLSEYGEFKKVRMNAEKYHRLAARFGDGKTTDYISRLDVYIASTGKRYSDHYATIIKWISEDEREAKSKANGKPNRFSNFRQRKRDFAELERQERKYLQDKVKNESGIGDINEKRLATSD